MFIVVAILLIIELYTWKKYRDFICPAVLHNIMWIVSAFFAGGLIKNVQIEMVALCVIVMGALIFQAGFDISLKAVWGYKECRPDIYEVELNKQTLKFIIVLLLIISFPVICQYAVYLRGAGFAIYSLLRSTDKNLSLPVLFDYFRKIVQFLSIGILICYWMAESTTKEDVKVYVALLTVVAILAVISVPTRNGILFYFLPVVMAFLATHNISNKKVLIIGVISILSFMCIFYLISLNKYWYMYDNASSAFSVLMAEIETYLSGGIAAFCSNISSHAYMYLGGNTFRFFQAVGDRFFGTSSAVKLVNEYSMLSGGVMTNVYTFYDYYVRDFGCLYAVFAQFIAAYFHGISYKGMLKRNPLQIYYFSFLSYPLVMQFFQDQYISLLSTWIQIIIAGLIVFKTPLFANVILVFSDIEQEN